MRAPVVVALAVLSALLVPACSPPGSHSDAGEPDASQACSAAGLDDFDGDTISDETEGEADPDRDGLPNMRDGDSDGDDLSDALEAGREDCSEDPVDTDEDGVPDYLDEDSDGNLIPDALEDQSDTDGDDVPNWRDRDDDGDRISDSEELGPDPMADRPDVDADGIADYHDTDSDNDGLQDSIEGSADIDGDGLGNWRDTDSDGDGLLDADEGTGDCDGDGLGSWIDIDSNGDGVPDWAGDGTPEGVCPACEPDCHTSGEIEPDPESPDAEGVEENPDGPGIVLGGTTVDAGYAWIANSEDPWPGEASSVGTVSKIDLDTGEEVGRFLVGLERQGNSPSRTAVDGNADAYIACRAFGYQGTVVKIASRPEFCDDRNRDGRIDTSTDSDPLPYGEDECVLWISEVGAVNATPRAMAVDLGGPDAVAGNPWVGLDTERRAVMLDPLDGSEVASVNLGVQPYGFALTTDGIMWVSALFSSAIQSFDPVGLEAGEVVSVYPGCMSGPYGIATDNEDRVWVASSSYSACRYDPVEDEWYEVMLSDTSVITRGIAVDAYDRVWAAAHGWSVNGWVFGFNAEDGSDMQQISTNGQTPVGVAIDYLGFVWAVNQSSSTAARIDPLAETTETFPVGQLPYTYSDFTGFQRSRIWSQGHWSQVFERCPGSDPDTEAHWGLLVWDVDTPPSTSIEFQGRTSDTREALDDAQAVTLATVPGTSSPVDIEAVFDEAGIGTGRFLKLTVVLRSIAGVESPVFRNVEVGWYCDEGPIE